MRARPARSCRRGFSGRDGWLHVGCPGVQPGTDFLGRTICRNQRVPSDYQLTVADEVTRSRDVDLVYGHHAHVVQPVRKVNGTWVAFGLGNFVAEQETEVVGIYEGMIAQFDLIPRRSGQVDVRWADYRPTYITRYDPARPRMRVHDIGAALGAGTLPLPLLQRMRAAKERVRSVVGELPSTRVSP